MISQIDVEIPLETIIETTTADVYINTVFESTIVNVYIKTATATQEKLPMYRSWVEALDAGAKLNSYYYNYDGILLLVGKPTQLWLNLSKAVSYLRRIF